jgi:selenocysteine-specific elongation factor
LERHVVIGTAGHIDHGKTALVKSLTGTDTDRWEEEKRRGITIDLGFAVLPLASDLTASIVDVPGHEDFVRNMVAGATGIDVALLVVAADEGMMPQTNEHLAILELLGVRAGVAAITKCDLVEDEWLELVEADIAERLEASSVQWKATVRTSAVTDLGGDELRAALASAATESAVRSQQDLFRMPVDRVFSVSGAGTVITGTTWSGSVTVGEDVRVLPGKQKARVRAVEVHGVSHEAALPGRRTALALVGLGRGELARGHVVVSDSSWRESTAVDAVVTLLPGAKPLTQRSRVRLHLGTAEVMARVTPATGEIVPGVPAGARLRLEVPLVCRWGDRAVIRSYSPMTTIGGCVVVDPWPPSRPRRPVDLPAKAAAEATKRLEAFVLGAGLRGLDVSELSVRVGLTPGEAGAVVESAREAVRAAGRLVSRAVLTDSEAATLRLLTEYHIKRPLDPGMPRGLIRQALRDEGIADHVLQALSDCGQIAIEGKTARLVEHVPRPSYEQAGLGSKILAQLDGAGPKGRSLSELEAGIGGTVSRDLVEFYVRSGEVVRVAKERYYNRGALDRLLLQILRVVDQAGRASPAQLREETGLTRKHLIPVLEWMDGMSLTRRDGDTRGLGPAADKVLNPVDSG